MKRGRVVSLLGGLAIVTGLLGASTAAAASLTGDYQFQGNAVAEEQRSHGG